MSDPGNPSTIEKNDAAIVEPVSMDWAEYQHEFSAQEDLLQIILADVTAKDWQKLLNFLQKSQADLTFSLDGVTSALPAQIEEVLENHGHQYLLTLRLDDLTLQCDFSRVDAIVLRFDPAKIVDATKATLLFRVMSTFGRRINKVAVLTAIHQEAQPIFRYEHGQGLMYLKLARKLGPYE